MSIARSFSVAFQGVQASLVEVEADLGNGIPGFIILGLPDASLNESRERVKAAARNSGIPLANRKLTVNLSPATLPKFGSAFDLAILIAALAADRQLIPPSRTVYLAELGLDGMLRPVPGVLPAVQLAVALGMPQVVVAKDNEAEARLVPGAQVFSADHVGQVLIHCGAAPDQLCINLRHRPFTKTSTDTATRHLVIASEVRDLDIVNGQEQARLALEIAAVGGHHLMMVGPPGAGKTLLASCLPSILPPLNDEQALEATAVRSLTSGADSTITTLQRKPVFVAPHHTASLTSLIGGGTRRILPGAITRAHHGVLFLDEVAHFNSGVLDALRQPIEDGFIHLDRTLGHARLPARFQLVMASNPCPCGRNYGSGISCSCTPMARRRYFARLSGPILDRTDLQLRINPVLGTQLTGTSSNESSEQVRQRVLAARGRSTQRLARFGIACNSQVPGIILRQELPYPAQTRTAIAFAADRLGLSARAVDRVLRVAWTVADQQEHEVPNAADVDVAVQLRQRLSDY
ncbi:YifB family Mg chelatase-like AAA ATPase [Glutamicibacter sp.]|uniref:YifB family Mg chelatase-like AAA ATPase n=1 Tax=Glutamicibacter sp. TaxID=1931995 RepID=UPI0028BE5DF0|nr:YifB family Mg chelatase-like AAA ATPase [Glutamicibacter sp.]